MTKLDNLIRLNQLAEQVHKQGKKVAVLLEGRDGAGKSGTIRDLLNIYHLTHIQLFHHLCRLKNKWQVGLSLGNC